MPYEDAACFIFTYGTSHHALKDRAHLKPGEALLILGAAGGVGAAAIELGKAAGARVIAAVSSPRTRRHFLPGNLGADETIVYPRDLDRDAQKALSTEIKELAGGGGVDVVYDAVGGDYAEPAMRALAWKGRFLVVGFPAGHPEDPAEPDPAQGLPDRRRVLGGLGSREPEGTPKTCAELFGMYADGKIKPRISARFPAGKGRRCVEDDAGPQGDGQSRPDRVMTVRPDARNH